MGYIKKKNIDVGDAVFIDEKCSNKEEYINKAWKEGYFL